jgi:ERCC4-related helicase
MDSIWGVIGELVKKLNEPHVIALMVLLFSAEWRNWAQNKEAREDRQKMAEALENITNKISESLQKTSESLQQIKNSISAITGRPLQ